MELTEQQKKFCREYMKDFNGAQSAIRAGYSQRAAKEQASRLLTNANVAIFLASLKAQASEAHKGLADIIVAELIKLGFSDIKNFLDSDNTIKDISQLSSELTACVESIKKTETEFGEGETRGKKTSIQIKLHSKLEALEKLARYVGLYEADNRQRGAVITVNIED